MFKRFLEIIFLSVAFVCNVNAKDFEHLFDALLRPAPVVLDLNILKSYPKFRTIHHDTFYRRDTVKNILHAYKEFRSKGTSAKIRLDTIDTRYLSAYGKMRKKQRIIETIDTKRIEYGIQVKRLAEATLAIRVKDVNNFYSVSFSDNNTDLSIVKNGRVKKIASFIGDKTRNAYLYLHDGILYIYYSYQYIGKCRLMEFGNSTICGFILGSNSSIDEFVVNCLDEFHDNKMDDFIESGIINNKQFGHWEYEKGLIAVSNKHTRNGKYSLRFQLDYYPDWEKHKIGGKRRTEISPKAIGAQPLDSWISSFDVYFPGKKDGDEYYATDSNSELFWQSHDKNAAKDLSPHLAMYIKDDIISFQTLSREELRNDKKNIVSNKTFKQNGDIAKLVDFFSENPSILELKKGEWHNFTIYIKEGYTIGQLPRTVVYIDGKKVVDWWHVNAYNCEENANYLKMGIYKWPWASYNFKGRVRKRVLYYDNITYLR